MQRQSIPFVRARRFAKKTKRLFPRAGELFRQLFRWQTRSWRTMLLTISLVVALVVLGTISIRPRRYARLLDGRNLCIPYRSKATVYREHAAFVAPRSRGQGLAVNGTEEKPIPDAVHSRIRRQKAMEADIDAYLVSHNISHKRPLRVRFQIFSNFVNWQLCTALGSAALGGIGIQVIGFDSAYSHLRRFEKYLDFVEEEGLSDEDIVVTMDSDVFWTGADFLPFLKKFARLSPRKESDLDVAAVRAWEDYGEKKAPLFMEDLQTKLNGDAAGAERPRLQMPPVVYNTDDLCWWGQHSKNFIRCPVAFSTLDHMIEVTRNHVSTFDKHKLGLYARECGDALVTKLREVFKGKRQWMMKDMLREPHTDFSYTKHPKRSRDDPLYYHTTVVSNSNPTLFLNGGVHISRVWALRLLAESVATYAATETPVAGEEDHHTSEWWCDQSLMGQLYVRGRLYEIEHNLLTGPPLSMRSPPVPYDRRYGPPGLVGLDRRSEMVILAPTMERNPTLFHHGKYLAQQFPGSSSSRVWNKTEYLLGVNEPQSHSLQNLKRTPSGAFVTVPLLWRSATADDKRRGFRNEVEDDPDVVYPPFIHYAAPTKHGRFAAQRNHFAWLVAARHDKLSSESVRSVFRKELVELLFNNERVFVNFTHMCEDPTKLSYS
ncbi:hypothetical protein JKF63_02145 [Porcisia hertigi]|uniref:Uncharacterized protein n=1 Tax=Porcisia hertigi TaxID=2761500 RepID=A0A836HYY9_9TRYP|nr:hypothetical protein JKF63_02145 [Porcisia hertigi]